jgi:SAM-dependent methyltransferase
MNEQASLIAEIEAFCRQAGVAESTFGRRVVNDGKFVGRLRDGKGVTTATVAKVRSYLTKQNKSAAESQKGNMIDQAGPAGGGEGNAAPNGGQDEKKKSAFRFYDNRQKYLMFVNTCSEKWVVAERAGMELAHIHPKPPALRVFDAGMGDGTVITGVMREMHRRFRTLPFYIVGKEISLEDVRLSLEKMSDRFYEHPATVLIVTNLYYTEAPTLTPRSMQAAATLNWIDVPLAGDSSHEFHEQIKDLQPTLTESWQVKPSEKTGNPLYVRPSVMVLYREDHKFLLDQIIPHPGQQARGDYDLVIASQPYRARLPDDFKVQKVIAPLARSLAPGGRLLGVHSHGADPGLEIIRRVWPGETPFISNRHDLLKGLKQELGKSRRDLNFNAYADKRALFRYDMHTLPSEVGDGGIGTSTLLAAWNAATYVAQIEDERLEEVIAENDYLDATRSVLNEYNGLWFNDESFVVSRRRD